MLGNRTKRTLQNTSTSIILLLVQIVVGFYSRKIFLNELGDELIGINTTLGNILSFLNLAELGIGTAMATSLYKPLHSNDYKTICEIITVQGILYKRIAFVLCICSIPILIYIPSFFPNTECSLLYIYIAYIVFLWGSISSYLWNYRQVLIAADQKFYKISIWIQVLRYLKIFFQLYFLLYTNTGIWGWIGFEFLGSTLTIFAINHVLHKEYPWLQKIEKEHHYFFHKYHHIIIKTKQLFVHQIATFVLEQTAPLIIYYFVSLSMVTYYGNYMIIVGYIASLLNGVFGGVGASIGSLVAENNKSNTLKIYNELFTSRLWISAIVCFVLFLSMEPFISLWIGEKYVLGKTTLILIILGLFIRTTRTIIESFKTAFQLFGDVWAPIAEAVLNLVGSIVFGAIWGLNGILLGVNTSLIIIVLIWKPYYTFSKGFHTPWINYYIHYALHLIIFLLCAWATIYITNLFSLPQNNFYELSFYIFIIGLTYSILSFLILFLLFKGMRDFTTRALRILHIKVK